jgi:CHASE2 domain-containing sensor protein
MILMGRAVFCFTGLLICARIASGGVTTRPTTRGSPFLIVLIDSRTEKSMGPFPYDRSVLADAVKQATRLHARAVVLKFFLDLPESKAGDLALADSMMHIPVILEACFNAEEKSPNPLPEKFYASGLPVEMHCSSGNSGWLPIPVLAAQATDIGFVDYVKAINVPELEQY